MLEVAHAISMERYYFCLADTVAVHQLGGFKVGVV